MKRKIFVIFIILLFGIVWVLLYQNSKIVVKNNMNVSETKVKDNKDVKFISNKEQNDKHVIRQVKDNNISEKDFFMSIQKMIADRGNKEFDDFFKIDTYEDSTGNVLGSYKVGMLEKVFENDQINLPFFDTYRATVINKSIDPSGYIEVDSNLEGDEDGYLGLVENKKNKVLSGVLYDYQGGTEYHIEGKNGQFKIFPIKEDGYIHGD